MFSRFERLLTGEPTLSPLSRSLAFLALIAFACAASPIFAVSPPPDGGYANENTAEGTQALEALIDGSYNTAVGYRALQKDTSGDANTGLGFSALIENTTGSYNTAVGISALRANTVGSDNTASGAGALLSNGSASYNTATGSDALRENTIGDLNTAAGYQTLYSNKDGTRNTATGSTALYNNTSGSYNTASGRGALYANTIGHYNNAYGAQALASNLDGGENAGYGNHALNKNTSGSYNTATGTYALSGNTTGTNNIALGYQAGSGLTTGSNNIDIGAAGGAGESNTIRIGRINVQKIAYMQGIFGATVANGAAVRIDSAGHLGTLTSSARFKEAIEPMDKASEDLLALRPVTFRYKHDLDPNGIPQFGLVAEEVEKVNPDLVVRDADGKINTVRYEAVNAMLLNEFLKEHRQVQEQQKKIAELESTAVQQQKAIAALTSGLQKVNEQIQLVDRKAQVVSAH